MPVGGTTGSGTVGIVANYNDANAYTLNYDSTLFTSGAGTAPANNIFLSLGTTTTFVQNSGAGSVAFNANNSGTGGNVSKFSATGGAIAFGPMAP